MTLIYRNDVVRGGIPPRADLDDASVSAFNGAGISRYWLGQFSKARDQLDEADQLPDGSEQRNALIDLASDIEERAIEEFLK